MVWLQCFNRSLGTNTITTEHSVFKEEPCTWVVVWHLAPIEDGRHMIKI